MINQSVNDLYTRSLFKIDALTQSEGFLLNISETLFSKFRPDVREFLISEGVQVPQILPTETNHQGNQSLLLVRNTAVESENQVRNIKASVQTSGEA